MGMHMGGGGFHMHGEEDEDDQRVRKVPDRVIALRLIKFPLKYRLNTVLMVLTALLQSGVALMPPVLIGMALDAANPEKVINLQTFTLAIIGFAVVNVLNFVAQYANNYLTNWLGGRMEFDIRSTMFKHFQKLSLRYYADKEVGSLISRPTNDVDKISELISSGIIHIFTDLLTLVGITVVMFSLSVDLSLIAFSIVPLMLVWMLVWGGRVRRVYRETRRAIASVSAQMEESVSGIKEIQTFSKENETRKEFQEVNTKNMDANVEATRVMGAFMPVITIFTSFGQALILYFGGRSVIDGTLTIGVLFTFMNYITRFFMPIQDLSQFWNSVQSAFAAAERVFAILDTPIEIKDPPNASELPSIQGNIVYDHMTFGYSNDVPVLKDINLVIDPNTTVAFVGPTGVGKTTMANLLYRFYDPLEGKITVDGHDLRDVKIDSLRKQMGIVLQDPFLFSGTIMDNIRYSRPKATDEEVIDVSKAIGAHEFIMRLPEGYQTDVKERGGRLSVGQRQLVSLARALLANPRILIMDEATSSIDAYTELIIQQAMNQLLKGRTAIVIAHRLSTVRNANMICVIEGGQVAEAGTHEELLKRSGLYKKLYEMQFKEPEAATPPTDVNQKPSMPRQRFGRP